MKKPDIRSLIETGEGPRVEWKLRLNLDTNSGKDEFAKDLSAMANTGPGEGYILVGVSDRGVPIGIVGEERIEERLQQVASSRIFPPVNFSSLWTEFRGKHLLIIVCGESGIRPHGVGKDVFVRRGKIVDKAYPFEVARMGQGIPLDDEFLSSTAPGQFQDPTLLTRLRDRWDTSFFPVTGSPRAYRSCTKTGKLDEPGVCPIFVPQFDNFMPLPEFGETRSAIVFEHELHYPSSDRETFAEFLRSLERRIRSPEVDFRAWVSYPLSWSISRDTRLDYGLGADNLCSALDTHQDGEFAGVLLFERVNVYKPTGLLIIAGEFRKREHELIFDKLGLKLMLSTIPLRGDWLGNIFQTCEILNDRTDWNAASEDALSEKVYYHKATTTRKTTARLKSLGFMGRDHGTIPEFDLPLGIVVDGSPLKSLGFAIDDEDSWQTWYADVFGVPTDYVNEIPISITNPVPNWQDAVAQRIGCRFAAVRQLTVSVAHIIVPLINVHGYFSRIASTDASKGGGGPRILGKAGSSI